MNHQTAKYVVAAARLNQHAIFQCYASHMQDLADRMPKDQVHPADIENTIHQTFAFEEGPLWDSPGNIQHINAIQDGYTARDRDPRANAPPCSQYGRAIPAEMQVEGEPTVYWKGLPKTFATCDYDSDELNTLLTENFCLGMPAHALSRTLTQWGYRPHLGDLPSG